MLSAILFHLHFIGALSLNPLALILGKEGPSSSVEPAPPMCSYPLCLLGFEDTTPAPPKFSSPHHLLSPSIELSKLKNWQVVTTSDMQGD